MIRQRAQIATTLRELRPGHFATFTAPDESYVQVAIDDAGAEARCEAVDFRSWPDAGYEDHVITPAMHARLEELGFEERQGENFARTMPWADPNASSHVADLLAWTLRDVYGMQPEDELDVTIGEFA